MGHRLAIQAATGFRSAPSRCLDSLPHYSASLHLPALHIRSTAVMVSTHAALYRITACDVKILFCIGTFYNVGLGACGITNVDTDFIAAVSYDFFDSYPGATANPNLNPLCGQSVQATCKPSFSFCRPSYWDRSLTTCGHRLPQTTGRA